jgi:hypothetical protein
MSFLWASLNNLGFQLMMRPKSSVLNKGKKKKSAKPKRLRS